MKKLLVIVSAVLLMSACSYHTCPTYAQNDQPQTEQNTDIKI
jgi:uncharacterized lipoprotein